MNEFVYLGLWLTASAFFGLHVFWRLGGIFSSLFNLLLWVVLYFSSTNVLASTGNGLVATNNPTAAWASLFAGGLTVLIAFMAMFGKWSPEEKEEEERGPGEYSLGDVLGGRL